jgi:drug/metabolite transporter (DMT)-like permease
MIALGAFGTAIANVIMTVATGRLGATRASATVFFIPVVALALGVAVRGEHVAPLSIVGAAVCLAGAWLIRPRPAASRREATAAAPACLEPASH